MRQDEPCIDTGHAISEAVQISVCERQFLLDYRGFDEGGMASAARIDNRPRSPSPIFFPRTCWNAPLFEYVGLVCSMYRVSVASP